MAATTRFTLAMLGLSLTVPADAAPIVTHLVPSGGQRGATVEVVAGGTFDQWPVQVWTSHAGLAAKAAPDKGKFSVAIKADVPPGVYWLRLHDETGASAPRPFIVGTLPEVPEAESGTGGGSGRRRPPVAEAPAKESNDEPSTAQKLDASTVVNGKLARGGDVDCYSIPLKKGQTLVAALDANHVLRSPIDAVLQVVSTAGFVLEQNHDFRGLDPRVVYTAPADGVVVVRVFAFPSQPDSSIRFFGSELSVYRLTVCTSGFVDFPVPLAVPRSAPGKVLLNGWNIPEAQRAIELPKPTSDTALSLVSPGALNAATVRVEPHPCFDLTQAPASQPLAVPSSATAILSKPDAKVVVPFTAAKGKAVQIQVESRTLDLAVNPVIRVLDLTGQSLARVEPAALNKDAELGFTPPADGTYRIEVGDLYDAGGPRHALLLRVTPVQPDYDLTVAADRFTVAEGKTLDIPVTITPRNGFKGTVELKVANLPEGVTAKVEMAAGKGTIKLTATKPVSGTFRIEGGAKTATAKLADFDTTIGDLFLTVTKAGK